MSETTKIMFTDAETKAIPQLKCRAAFNKFSVQSSVFDQENKKSKF